MASPCPSRRPRRRPGRRRPRRRPRCRRGYEASPGIRAENSAMVQASNLARNLPGKYTWLFMGQ
eukprot:6429364-Alexandrium_andersonii.AAC.1